MPNPYINVQYMYSQLKTYILHIIHSRTDNEINTQITTFLLLRVVFYIVCVGGLLSVCTVPLYAVMFPGPFGRPFHTSVFSHIYTCHERDTMLDNKG